MREVVHSNLTKASKNQKSWYDRKARVRSLQESDQVLVLLPTSKNKLFAQWQGPYPVVKKMGSVNYQIDMHDRRKRLRTFHVNMLKKYMVPTAMFNSESEDGEDIPDYKEQDGDQVYAMGEQLRAQQKTRLKFLLRDFADTLRSVPGQTTITDHKIELVGPGSATRLPPYKVPYAFRAEVQLELQHMLETGIIQPSKSEWASPLVIVKKNHDGSLQLCVEYRKLNGRTKVDPYPMPRVYEMLDRLGKAKFITTLDLSRGYWQVPLSEQARQISAFITPFGHFEFKVMPFGLCGAPATFQRMMDSVTQGLDDYAAAYIDDLVIHSMTWEEHLSHIEEVLKRLGAAGLTVKPAKCQFGMAKCGYLGHIVGGGRVEPETAKINAVQSFQQPRTKKQVRVFLGLAGYYRKFIPNFATVAAPLTDLTRKMAPEKVTWTPSCGRAFRLLKKALCDSPVLRSPDFYHEFLLQTDASMQC